MANNKKEKFIIIDGNALLHRAWHALPPLTTQKGEVVNAVYGFMMIFLKTLKELKPDYIAVAWDRKEPTFRHKIFKEYKAQRIKQPQELYNQINHIKQLMTVFNVPNYEMIGYEADDIIATIVALASEKKIRNMIFTGDLDALQLINSNTEVHTFKRGITNIVVYDRKAVEERYGLSPEQLLDFKALRGDPSDNIPGVPGIGEKTALNLIKEFGSLEELFKNIDRQNKRIKEIREKVRELLIKHREQAFLSKKLVKPIKEVPIKFSLENCRVREWKKEEIVQLFKELEFRSLLQRIPEFWEEKANNLEEKKKRQAKRKYILVDTEEKFRKFLKKLKEQKLFSLDTETTSINPFEAELLGISFCWKKEEAYYLVYSEKYLREIKSILEDKKIKKCGHHIKYDSEVLEKYKIDLKGISFDTMIAAYLLNPGSRAYGLDNLVFHYFGYQMQPIEDLIGSKKDGQISMKLVSKEKVSWYSCEDADYTFRLKQKLEPLLIKNNLIKLFKEIEMPLIPVLKEMETNGVKIDKDYLKKMDEYVTNLLKSLKEKIYKLAGEEFNISSSVQLRDILFKKLKISSDGIKKIKTGLSTAASELVKLQSRHPIINLIFEYRELTKLKTTYLEALPKLINPKTKRIHTSFNQTITATGRLSSSKPNLQNIPVRTDLGRKTRKAFIAEKGYKLLSADYSQIELRIIAHLANDRKMIKSFKKDEDIHVKTATEINNCRIEEVTRQIRRSAKIINFGIIYGMSVFGLAQSAGISPAKAKEFMERYFKSHPEIKEYIEKIKKQAYDCGYVQTLFGRKRFLPELHSNIPQLRNEAERMAINMSVQGTAADLIKLAMINVMQNIEQINAIYNKNVSKPVKLILQIHDELIFEVKEDMVEQLAKKIKKEMENIVKLRVPIKIDLKAGNNWGEMESLEIFIG